MSTEKGLWRTEDIMLTSMVRMNMATHQVKLTKGVDRLRHLFPTSQRVRYRKLAKKLGHGPRDATRNDRLPTVYVFLLSLAPWLDHEPFAAAQVSHLGTEAPGVTDASG